ncbi:eCIS core domain-containing protein [Achromobacter kerstersii]|jgi:hypothetical protein|uniref:eCIS core domain-containing protein n=1 Tax=Achromobacter kerstersii TaxID=1353890 RepID=A0A6S6ZW03_9BURK|nr:DUF4157 domain-containing protein [Achromobacter kerstersii]CAB3699415.1 hypothetical protein LMG3441_02470 [Achromobacter kerstersii]
MNSTCKIAALLYCCIVWGPVSAGGLLGDIINHVAPGAGTALDQVHAGIKDNLPLYKDVEEGGSKVVNEGLTQATAPLLQEAIARSRDDALRSGVSPIPPAIRQNLSGYIPDHILNIARFRVGGGGDLSIQVNAIRYGDAAAITLDYVIVFANQNDAFFNPVLWAHELTHVQQYQDWGLRDFAIRYVRNHNSVETVAYEAEQRYMAWVAARNTSRTFMAPTGVIPAPRIDRPVYEFPQTQLSSMCSTAVTACDVDRNVPVGTPCWCNTPRGAATGAIIPPQQSSSTQPTNQAPQPVRAALLGSGFTMQMCGCWGSTPNFTAYEPQCMSQQVILVACPGMCGPSGQPYGYVCK